MPDTQQEIANSFAVVTGQEQDRESRFAVLWPDKVSSDNVYNVSPKKEGHRATKKTRETRVHASLAIQTSLLFHSSHSFIQFTFQSGSYT